MNAITHWISEHFSLNAWCASFDGFPTQFGVISLGYVAWPDYREVTCELLGFGFALGYWPDGKWDETDGAGA